MLKILKWAYNLGEKHAKDRTVARPQALAHEHSMRAEIADLKKKDREKDKYLWYQEPRLSSQQHQAVSNALYDLLDEIDPVKHPSIDWELEKML